MMREADRKAARERAPRRRTRRVSYGPVDVGGDAPVSIQSMCTCPAAALDRAIEETAALAKAGCQIVRVALKDTADLEALPDLCRRSPIPVVADVHFDHRLAVGAAGAGAAGLRINPGNIGGAGRVESVIEAAAAAGIPVRVGVNSGSIEKDLRGRHRSDPAGALAESALRSLEMIERTGFGDLVFSLKSSDPAVTVDANLIFAARCDYPLHVGVTEAGPPLSGTARSIVALTRLFSAGVGDTVRISLSGDPVDEVIVASAMLTALGLRDDFPQVISCPTCGRCHIDVPGIAGRLEREINGCGAPLRVAVMGCEVNGPGEAADADAGIAGSPRGAVLFRRGEIVGPVKGDPLSALLDEVRRLTG